MATDNRPFRFQVLAVERRIPESDRVLTRRLSALRGYFFDQVAYEALLAAGDVVVYEVHELRRPEESGELLSGLSIVYPGLVGEEYFMTMGHFHKARQTAEIYLCLSVGGALVMENEQGDSLVEELTPGRGVYVAPGWAHRSVNLDLSQPLVTFFVYPGHAGHDYATIGEAGFRKLVLRRGGSTVIVDNPRRIECPTGVRT